MKRIIITTLLILTLATFSLGAAEDITGFWKSISDETGLPQSITAIYNYNGKVYGRVVVTFDDFGVPEDTLDRPVARAELIKGDPFYAGLDFIWDMEERGNKWSRGKIMDPPVAKIYSCDMWIEDGNLIVRGKIGPFGRNQTWYKAQPSDLPAGFRFPDYSRFRPTIPEPK